MSYFFLFLGLGFGLCVIGAITLMGVMRVRQDDEMEADRLRYIELSQKGYARTVEDEHEMNEILSRNIRDKAPSILKEQAW